ncbi:MULTISPECIES: transaldolase family protein [Clostridium]|uniref:transaldolase family protein n=1 Tax=Clostridium TaxID=1485 RepID=UPI0003D2CB59|nr:MULTISPECIES: transaldolase family protein [Clostridium]ALB48332.1 fructose-6-phosphate aldolase [Clostridium beijerinckii NRRL B-598]OVE66625.1 fructose-6-phosphate aldolase [Clostridium diolis]
MLMLIDDANLDEIKRIYEFYPCDGVTTNPSILKKQGGNPMEVLKAIREFLPEGAQLHAQVVSLTAEKMVDEAQHMIEVLGKDTYIKIPVTPEGIKAMKLLSKENVNITATAIYTSMQAFMAAKAGARYTAPYVNRIDNMGADGVQVAKDIHDMFKMHGLNSDVLAASFKNSQQVLNLCKYGIGSVTAAPDVVEGLIKHDATKNAVDVFTKDFYSLVGEGNTMEGL